MGLGLRLGLGLGLGDSLLTRCIPATPPFSWSALTVLLDPVRLFGSTQCPAASVRTPQRSCEFWDPTPVYGNFHFVVAAHVRPLLMFCSCCSQLYPPPHTRAV